MDVGIDTVFKYKTAQVLRLLEKETEMTSAKLTEAIGHKTIASILMDNLSKMGLVKRTVMQDKRRRVMWSITPDGRKLCRIMDWTDGLESRRAAKLNKTG